MLEACGLLEAGDRAQKEDHRHRHSQEKSSHHIRGIVLVVHDAGASDGPGQPELHQCITVKLGAGMDSMTVQE